MNGVFVAFIKVVYGRMIYMSLPIYQYILIEHRQQFMKSVTFEWFDQ